MADMLLVSQSVIMVLAFGFGIIIGSFLNVVIYRLHTGRSLQGSSHCLSCGKPLRFFELIPLFSYLGLFGRCSYCHSRIPSRYFLVELLTGVLFALCALTAVLPLQLAFLWLIMSGLVVIVVYDLYHYIIPDELVVFITVVLSTYWGWQFFAGLVSLETLIHLVVAAALGSGFLLFLWLISKGQWIGFGDVKLAFPLGLLVGPYLVFSMIVWSFWLGAGISLILLGLSKMVRGKLSLRFLPAGLTIKSAVPFAPFLVAGALLVFFTKNNVLTLFTF